MQQNFNLGWHPPPKSLISVFLVRCDGWLQSSSAGPLWPAKLCQEAKVAGADGARIFSHLPLSHRHQPKNTKSERDGEAGLTD